MSSSRRVAIAIILGGLALCGASTTWLLTRKLVALDISVSLSPGHTRTEEFVVNLDSGYYIQIEVERTPSLGNLGCQVGGCYETPAILGVQWVLSSAGKIALSGNGVDINGDSGAIGVVGRKVGYFRSSGGRYRLDLDVQSGASVLNDGRPWLRIEADGEGYNHLSRLNGTLPAISVMVVVIGIVLLVLSCAKQNAGRQAAVGAAAVGSKHQTAGLLQKLPRQTLFLRLPPFGLVNSILVTLVLVPSLLLVAAQRVPAKGIWVLTSSRSLKTEPPS